MTVSNALVSQHWFLVLRRPLQWEYRGLRHLGGLRGLHEALAGKGLAANVGGKNTTMRFAPCRWFAQINSCSDGPKSTY